MKIAVEPSGLPGLALRRLWVAAAIGAALMYAGGRVAFAGPLVALQVAYAGSMASMMDQGIKPAVAKALGADLQGRPQGSMGLANLIVGGSIRPDVFIAVTPEPMRKVLQAGKADEAVAIARTEMVLAYSPHSSFASLFAKAGEAGAEPWWQILESSGLRFGRTDPAVDPLGLNTLFMMQLAADYYKQPDLPDKIIGAQINPAQIFQEPDLMARLQAGQLDASSAYGVQPQGFGLPFVALPSEINLGDQSEEAHYKKATVVLGGKTIHPSPLVYYVAALKAAPHPAMAARFVTWLRGADGREILSRYHYDDPGSAQPLK